VLGLKALGVIEPERKKHAMDNEKPTIIVREKSDGTAVKVATIFGLIFASPFIAVFGFLTIVSVVGIVFGTMHFWVPYLLLALLVASLVPSVRERFSGKHDRKDLETRLHQLEKELSDARMQIQTLEEGADFQRKLSAGSGSAGAQGKSESLKIKQPEEQQ